MPQYIAIVLVISYRNNGTAFLTLDNESPQDVTSPYTSLDTTSNYWIGTCEYEHGTMCVMSSLQGVMRT